MYELVLSTSLSLLVTYPLCNVVEMGLHVTEREYKIGFLKELT